METEHVHDPHRGERRPEEFGPLVQHGPDEQAAVRAARDGEPGRLGDRVVDQELGGGDEVVEDVLLVLEHARPVPALAVLPAAPQVGLRVDPAAFEEHEVRRIEARRQADVEPAVAVEQGRVVPVARHVLPVGEEHGDLGAVLRGEEHLVGLVLLEVEGNVGGPVGLRFARGEVVAVDRRREEERGEGEVEDLVLPGPAQLSDRADAGKRHVPLEGAVHGVDGEAALRVVEIAEDEAVPDDARNEQGVLALRDDLQPVAGIRAPDVDRHHPVARRVVVGQEVETLAVVAEEVVGGVELVEDGHDLAVEAR